MLCIVAAAGGACIIIFGFQSGIKQFGELLGFLAIGAGILLVLLIIATLYHSLYWRWRLKPCREKLDRAVKLYRDGDRDEAKRMCAEMADDSRVPPLARVLACANCASFTTESGDEEEAKEWREKAFRIDPRRAENVFALLDATRHESHSHDDSCGCDECAVT